jgi:hypothetical protein
MHYWRSQHGSDVTHLFDTLGEDVVVLHQPFGSGHSFTDSFVEAVASAGFSIDDVKLHPDVPLMFTKNETLAMWIKLKYV